MKPYKVILIVLAVLLLDQSLKIWVKTHMAATYKSVDIKTYLHPDPKDPRNEEPAGEITALNGMCRLHFTENPGMAFGMVFPGIWGKLFLSLFRLAAVGIGLWYVMQLLKDKAHWGFITACALILAGAIGNMIDGAFYGMIFSNSYGANTGLVATMFPKGGGYAGFLQGHVVDMLYFPVIHIDRLPDWFPFWKGEEFEFFRPVFNIADSAITGGVFVILVFQKYFFKEEATKTQQNQESATADAPHENYDAISV